MDSFKVYYEEFRVRSRDLVDKIRELVHESNIRRIIIKDDQGNTFMEIPLSVATIGALFAPLLAAIGAIAALVADFTIVLERVEEVKSPDAAPGSEGKPPDAAPAPEAEPAGDASPIPPEKPE
jgi:hypothetical protein